MELECSFQDYHWGCKGGSSLIAKLLKTANDKFIVDEIKPYAELWMGIHPSGPSRIKDEQVSLEEYIVSNPESLGENVRAEFGDTLPFLFKVLSINLPLSIQVHPTKSKARELHIVNPTLYRDPNHKPEMAIALSDFEVLVGFRSYNQIKTFLKEIPELREIIGELAVLDFINSSNEMEAEDELKKCFSILMASFDNVIKSQLNKLIDRLQSAAESEKSAYLFDLLSRLNKNYPGDVGCFCIYFFNYFTLKPGESVFLPAGEPHAYIKGDCVECMANSDNVIRAGLTVKALDVITLCDIINYEMLPFEHKLFKSKQEDDNCILFTPPVKEFAVAKIKVEPNQSYTMTHRNSPSIIIVISGSGCLLDSEIKTGQVFFFPAYKTDLKLDASADGLLVFQAFVNV